MNFRVGNYYQSESDPQYCLRIVASVDTHTYGECMIAEDGTNCFGVSVHNDAADDFHEISHQAWFMYLEQLAVEREKTARLAKSGLFVPPRHIIGEQK